MISEIQFLMLNLLLLIQIIATICSAFIYSRLYRKSFIHPHLNLIAVACVLGNS